MEEENQRLYEGMYIISATLSEEARNKALDRIKKEITSRGGEIVKEHQMGRRRLAYPIDGHKEGHYYIIYFKAPAEAISPSWHEYQLNEDLIRFMTLTVDVVEEEIKYKELELIQ